MSEVDAELLQRAAELNNRRYALERSVKTCKEELTELLAEIKEQMIDASVANVKITSDDGDSTFYLQKDEGVGYDCPQTFHAILDELGMSSLRKVNSQTLKSWFKKEAPESMHRQDGESLDEYALRIKLNVGLRLHFATKARIRRSN